jgi:NAD(P)-dependent dehydrogenase (short-subunit alcohol dehydrogenase family)
MHQVFVAGASKGVGRECVQQLLAAGKEVVAMVRTKEAAEDMKSLGATAIVANAFDYKVCLPKMRRACVLG